MPKLPDVLQSRRNQIVIAFSGLILIGGVVALQFKPAAPQEASLQTVIVTRGPIIQSVAATGKVVPNFEVEIKGKASGKILSLPYDVSDAVDKGDLLVELDPIDESRDVNQASASLAGVQSRMDQTRLNLQAARQNLATDIARAKADLQAAEITSQEAARKQARLETLVQNCYISQEEFDAGNTAQVQAQSQLTNAQVRLRELQTQQIALQAQAKDLNITAAEARAQNIALATSQQRLAETRIYAPISGVVTSREGQIGQIVASGISNVGGGTAIMTLADLSRIYVLASVDESDIGRVRDGQMVDITADAFPGEIFKGHVVRISPKGTEESNVVTFEVKIEVTGDNKKLLMPEMTANVEIFIQRKGSVLQVPSEAITTKNGKTAVRVLPANNKSATTEPEVRLVSVGINNGSQTEILSGLKVGDTVVTGQGGDSPASRWKKDPAGGGSGGGLGNRRNQRTMMRGMGRR